MSGKIYIGTSGWNYDGWKGNFYPAGVTQKNFLSAYAENFSTSEINTSFYGLPSTQTVKNWKKATPDDFIFAIKASRYITHNKKLKDPKDSVQRFFEAIRPLGDKTGPILFQLPPKWKVNTERLSDFLKIIARRKYRYTFEFRHDSWHCEEVYDLLRKYNAALCLYDLAQFQSPEIVTADFIYIRLHGPSENKYQGSYDTKTLKAWAAKMKDWSKKKDVYCYFDNDQKGYAPADALRLMKILNQ